jgi:hypothetical protein
MRRSLSLRQRGGEVRVERVDHHTALLRDDDEVHVLHRDRAEQHLVAQDHRADKTHAVVELDLHRADIGTEVGFTVGGSHFLLVLLLKLELRGNVRGQAEKNRARVGQRAHPNRPQVGTTRVDQGDVSVGEAHAGNQAKPTKHGKRVVPGCQGGRDAKSLPL